MSAAFDLFEQRKARQWLRDRDIPVRLPRPGWRLLVVAPDFGGGPVVIERVEHHVEGRVRKRYLICAAGAAR